MNIKEKSDFETRAREMLARVTTVENRELLSLCKLKSGSFLPDDSEATRAVSAQIQWALKQRKPLSLIRVGDGEGRALAVAERGDNDPQMQSFQDMFVYQNGLPLSPGDTKHFCNAMRSAVLAADIVGFRFGKPDASDNVLIGAMIEAGKSSLAVGVLGAREFLQTHLAAGSFRTSVLVGKLIYAPLLARLPDLVQASQGVIVITGREVLKTPFERQLGGRLLKFLKVPIECCHQRDQSPEQQVSPTEAHYPATYRGVMEALQGDLRGVLVLVGAGLFGKTYCHRAQQSGAVAVDLGSGFDLLAGQRTRPAHSAFKTDELTWPLPCPPHRTLP